MFDSAHTRAHTHTVLSVNDSKIITIIISKNRTIKPVAITNKQTN